jgi:hypothetical protein
VTVQYDPISWKNPATHYPALRPKMNPMGFGLRAKEQATQFQVNSQAKESSPRIHAKDEQANTKTTFTRRGACWITRASPNSQSQSQITTEGSRASQGDKPSPFHFKSKLRKGQRLRASPSFDMEQSRDAK